MPSALQRLLDGPDPRPRLALKGLLLGLLTYRLGELLGLDLPRRLEPYTAVGYVAVAVAAMLAPPRWRRAWWAATAALVLLSLVVTLTPLPRLLLQRLVVDDGPRPADVIVVLSGSTRADFPRINSTERLLEGLRLLHAGYAPVICFTSDPNDPTNQFEAMSRDIARGLRLPTDRVVPFVALGGTPMNTRKEAQSIAAMAIEHGWRRILLVTSPSHTRRARGVFRGAGLDAHVVACPTGRYDLDRQGAGSAFEIWGDLLYELQGLALYRARGWLADEAPAGAAELRIFVAASLLAVTEQVAHRFEAARPGTKVVLNAAGTQQLRAQLEAGARADLFLSANAKHAEELHAAGLLEAPEPFAGNRLAIVRRRGDDAPTALDDLAEPNRRLVICGPSVPAGKAAAELFARWLSNPATAELARRMRANIVSEEPDVLSALAKVELGEADAAFVYWTDALREGLDEVPYPEPVTTSDVLGICAGALEPELARQFAELLLSEGGQEALAAAGFERVR